MADLNWRPQWRHGELHTADAAGITAFPVKSTSLQVRSQGVVSNFQFWSETQKAWWETVSFNLMYEVWDQKDGTIHF